MLVFYIRHNWGLGEFSGLNQRLFDSKKICIHYEDVVNPFDRKQYRGSTAKTAIDYINRVSDHETLIVASYAGQEEMLIGISVLGSKYIETVENSQLKVIQLRDAKVVRRHEFPLPFVIPPPFSAFVRWRMGEAAVNSFYFEQAQEPKLNMLLPWHLEILSEEWLRKQKLLRHKIFQTGKYMKDFDIVGVNTDGEYVIAQVKYRATDAEVDHFFKQAEPLAGKNSFFFAGNRLAYAGSGRVIHLQEVFDEFTEAEPEYIQHLYLGYAPEKAKKIEHL